MTRNKTAKHEKGNAVTTIKRKSLELRNHKEKPEVGKGKDSEEMQAKG